MGWRGIPPKTMQSKEHESAEDTASDQKPLSVLHDRDPELLIHGRVQVLDKIVTCGHTNKKMLGEAIDGILFEEKTEDGEGYERRDPDSYGIH